MVAAEQSAAELTRVQAERDAVSSDLINAYERISPVRQRSVLAAELDNFARLRRILREQILPCGRTYDLNRRPRRPSGLTWLSCKAT